MRGFASWTRVPVVTTTSGRKGEPKGDQGDGARRMDRAGEGKKEKERERERNGRGSGRVRNAKRRKVRRGWKGVQEGNGRKGERGEQEFPLFPPNKAFPYFDTRIDIDSNETIKKGRKTMKVNIYK